MTYFLAGPITFRKFIISMNEYACLSVFASGSLLEVIMSDNNVHISLLSVSLYLFELKHFNTPCFNVIVSVSFFLSRTIYIHTHTHLYIYIYMCVCVCACLRVCVCIYMFYMCMNIYICVYAHTYICMYTYKLVYYFYTHIIIIMSCRQHGYP